MSKFDNENYELLQTVGFFELLYGKQHRGVVTLWTKQNKRTHYYATAEPLAKQVLDLRHNTDVYFGIGLRRKNLGEYSRGSESDIVALPGAWLDVDLTSPAHKEKNLPPDMETAKRILGGFPLPYSVLIKSGHGIYPIWLFDELLVFTSDMEKKRVKAVLGKFHKVMAHLYKNENYHLDNTSDLARILRVPNSFNHKLEPVLVKVLEVNANRRYSLEIFSQMVDELYSQLITPKPAVAVDEENPAVAELILSRCPFLKHCKDDAHALPEPHWYFGLVSIISRTKDGAKLVHKLSEPYPTYSRQETDKKIAHALESRPSTCKTIQEKCGDEYCSNCRFNGKIRTPLDLGIAPKRTTVATMPFPLDALPDQLRAYVIESADALCCPTDFIAVPLLVCAGGVIGNSMVIALKDTWRENAGLYTAIVGDPSAKKSPALSAATKFINEQTKVLMEEYKAEVEEYEVLLREYERKRDLGNTEGHDKPKKPILPRLYTMDTTVEALADLMLQNPKGIFVIRDELSALTNSMNQYKASGGSDRQFYLTSWTGGPYTVDRKGKDPIVIPRAFLGIVGAIPPDIIGDLQEAQKRDDGFIDRFLFAFPEPKRQKWTDSTISIEAESEARACFNRLFSIRYSTVTEKVLNLTPNAKKIYSEWYDSHYAELDCHNFPKNLRGTWGKMPGQVGRIALIIHCCKHGNDERLVDEQSIQSAIAIAEYFKEHAKKVHGVLKENTSDMKVKSALDRLNKLGRNEVTPRQIYTDKVAGCKNADQARELMNLLMEQGYGVSADDGKSFLLF